MGGCCITQYMCGDWERLEATLEKPKQKDVLRDNNTGETYNKDPDCLIRLKCGMLSIGNAFRTVLVLIYDLGKLIWDIMRIAALTIWNFGKEIVAACRGEMSTVEEGQEASFCSAFKILGKGLFVELPTEAGKDIWRIIRDPLCGLAIEFIAVYGILDPYNARKMIGKIEKYGFNEGLPVSSQNAFYLAPCFQCRPPSTPPGPSATAPAPLSLIRV